MKKLITLVLILVLAMSCLMLTSFADESQTDESTMKTVYLSDNGEDTNNGLTSATAVKTFAKATSLLGESGIIMIPDKYTYANGDNTNCPYRMPGTTGATYIIRGEKADGSSTFAGERYMIVATANLTFDNLTYTVGEKTYAIVAEFYKLEFTKTVTTIGYSKSDGSVKYPIIFGGSYIIYGNEAKKSELVLNGGIFKDVYCGCEKQKLAGPAFLTLGGNVKVTGNVYFGGKNTGSDMQGDITVVMTGGTVDGKIYLGGNDEGVGGNYISSWTINVTVSGGTFAGIVGTGTNGVAVDAMEILLDLTAYQPSSADGWEASNISGMPDFAKIWTYGENKNTSEDNSFTSGGDESVTPGGDESVTPGEDESVTHGEDDSKIPSETNAEEKTATATGNVGNVGCQSTAGMGAIVLILTVSGTVCWALKKKESE